MSIPDYRATHKTELQTILQSLTFEGSSLSVSTHYRNAGISDPYIYITSGGYGSPTNAFESSKFNLDTGSYLRSYQYMITAVWKYASDDNVDPLQEARIDTLEQLILNKLQTQSIADGYTNGSGVTVWINLIVKEVAKTFSPNPITKDGLIYEDFVVEVWNIIDKNQL